MPSQSALVEHGCLRPTVPGPEGVCFLHFFLHFFLAALLLLVLHFCWQDFASASSPPSHDVSPSGARVPATVAPRRPRREPCPPILRTSRSNAEPSMASFQSW